MIIQDLMSYLLLGARGLHPRDSTCRSPTYTTPIGLQFQTFCGYELACSSSTSNCNIYTSENVTSMDVCMNICSSRFGAKCYGITYQPSTKNCVLKGAAILANNSLSTDSSVHSALANSTQLAPLNTTCPQQTKTLIDSSDGAHFNLSCGLDYAAYGDYVPWKDVGTGISTPHADTFERCLELCTAAHPLCRAVSWNPSQGYGYGNCYIKDHSDSRKLVNNSDGYVVHSAEITLSTVLEPDPTIPLSYTPANSNLTFKTIQNGRRSGSANFTSIHTKSPIACMDQCAANKTCVGMYFDPLMFDGYRNCYLLNDTGSPLEGYTVYTFALYANDTSLTTNPSDSSNTPSKAWIAGPVVGGVVFVALVIFLVVFCRRRRARRRGAGRTQSLDDPHKTELLPQSKEARRSRNASMLPTQDNINELPAQSPAQELPANDLRYK